MGPAPGNQQMDSLTQFALGSAVGVLVLGRSQPRWRAALTGGICGTLPDLDAFIQHGDPILDMVRHRAETHAFALQTAATPVIALAFAALTRSMQMWPRWLLAVWLILVTHAGLDAMTVYGTRLLLPFNDLPLGLGSIFIIDPLYTLPLLAGIVAALVSKRFGLQANAATLALSTLYLGWSAVAQFVVQERVAAQLAASNAPAQHVLVTPTAFNTLLWRVLVMREDSYDEGFYALPDYWFRPGARIQFARFDRDARLDAATADMALANEIRQFSRGFYRVEERDGTIRITDLRMGQEPYYVFSFEFAQRSNNGITNVPTRQINNRADMPVGEALRWIWHSMWGDPQLPPR